MSTTLLATPPTAATAFQTAPAPALRSIPAMRRPGPRVGDGGPTLDRAITQAW